MQRPYLLLTSAVVAVLAFIVGAEPAMAEPTTTAKGSNASQTTGIAALPTAPVSGSATNQVLVAQGDGWYLYADATSARSVSVSQVQGAGGVTVTRVTNCGIASCSVYLSRATTRSINADIIAWGGGFAGLAAACSLFTLISGPAGIVVGAACGADIAVGGAFLLNAVSHAAKDNGCLRIRFTAIAPEFTSAFCDDHSGYCHNN